MESKGLKALLIDGSAALGSALVRRLEKLGYQCVVAGSFPEARLLLEAGEFEIVLSRLEIREGNARDLRRLLVGRASSLYYSHAVEDGCWWIPGVIHGVECFGAPAVRSTEFLGVLRGMGSSTVIGTAAEG